MAPRVQVNDRDFWATALPLSELGGLLYALGNGISQNVALANYRTENIISDLERGNARLEHTHTTYYFWRDAGELCRLDDSAVNAYPCNRAR